ncbi:unnamed protein product [Closterium sp. NIES-54]
MQIMELRDSVSPASSSYQPILESGASAATANLVTRRDVLSDIRIETMAAGEPVNRTIERGLTFLQLWAQANGVKLSRIATVNVDGNLSRIAKVNVDGDGHVSLPTTTTFFSVPYTVPSANITWNDIYPEWIDESQNSSCPEIPEPDWYADESDQAGAAGDGQSPLGEVASAAEPSQSSPLVARSLLGSFDGVVASLPCESQPADSWARDVRWHHLMLTAGRLVTKVGVQLRL